MLSVVIETRNDEEALAHTLASLVGGAVEGVVREVIVCDRGSSDGTHAVADHTGCRYMTMSPLASGIRQAKSEWLLLLEPGARLCEGWTEVVSRHTECATRAARFTEARNGRSRFLSRVFSAGRPLAAGLLVTRHQALALAQKASDAETIARRLAAKRLDAEILVAPRKKQA